MRQINDTDHANTGLGEKVKPAPAPATETWTPTGTAGVERNSSGQVRTNIPANEVAAPIWPPRHYTPVVVEDSGDEE